MSGMGKVIIGLDGLIGIVIVNLYFILVKINKVVILWKVDNIN